MPKLCASPCHWRRNLRKYHGVTPNLHVQSWCQEPLECKRFYGDVQAVAIDSPNDEFTFLFGQEPPASSGFVGEVHNKHVAQASKDNGDLQLLDQMISQH